MLVDVRARPVSKPNAVREAGLKSCATGQKELR